MHTYALACICVYGPHYFTMDLKALYKCYLIMPQKYHFAYKKEKSMSIILTTKL